MSKLIGFSLIGLAAAVLAGQAPVEVAPGLEVRVTGVERATNVSLQDCPPGSNIVRGVIRPAEENEFATVKIGVKVLPSYVPAPLEKPVLYDDQGKAYKTAQSFGEVNAEPSYTCSFSFRVPKGTKLDRLTIGDASFDLRSLEGTSD